DARETRARCSTSSCPWAPRRPTPASGAVNTTPIGSGGIDAMLAPQHVRARRRGDRLKLVPLSAPERQRALELATTLLASTRALVGSVREQVELTWDEIPCEPREQVLLEGLKKLVSHG